jgi:ABC-type uncharacterized transport system permease subunit
MDSAQRVCRFGRFRPLGRCRPLVTVLIVPVVLLAAVPILVGLLGIFVIWLIGVSSLVAAILVSDLIRYLLRPAAKADVGRSAVGVPTQ